MRSRPQDIIYRLAQDQMGYFTSAQAVDAGVEAVTVVDMHRRSVTERITRGVYRLVRFPTAVHGQYMEASLWPQVRLGDVRGVISHASALAFYEMSDASPAVVHITLPKHMRIRRSIPRVLKLHFADLPDDDIRWSEGLPVTTPVRTVRDCHAAHLGPALIRQAIEDGRRNGWLTYRDADILATDLVESPHRHGSDGQHEHPRK